MQNMEKGGESIQKRVQSDIELAKGGAEYTQDAPGSKIRLEATPEQVEAARQMMNEDRVKKDQERLEEIKAGLRKIELDDKEGGNNVANMKRGSYLRSEERKWGEPGPEEKRAA